MSLAIVFAGTMIALAIDPAIGDMLTATVEAHPNWTIVFLLYLAMSSGGSSTTVRNIVEKGKEIVEEEKEKENVRDN